VLAVGIVGNSDSVRRVNVVGPVGRRFVVAGPVNGMGNTTADELRIFGGRVSVWGSGEGTAVGPLVTPVPAPIAVIPPVRLVSVVWGWEGSGWGVGVGPEMIVDKPTMIPVGVVVGSTALACGSGDGAFEGTMLSGTPPVLATPSGVGVGRTSGKESDGKIVSGSPPVPVGRGDSAIGVSVGATTAGDGVTMLSGGGRPLPEAYVTGEGDASGVGVANGSAWGVGSTAGSELRISGNCDRTSGNCDKIGSGEGEGACEFSGSGDGLGD